jgi:serine/threonine-protein kinase RsbW
MPVLRLPATLDALAPIRDFVADVAASAGLEKHAVYKLMTGVDEIVTNIVLYGYQGSGQEGDVQVNADITDNDLIVELVDTSPAFNPLDKPAPNNLDAPLDERAIGGLGIYMAVNSADEYEYEYTNGANINRFIVHRQTETDGTTE